MAPSIALVLALSLFLPPMASIAAEPLPGSIEPGQLEKRFTPPLAPRALPEAVVPESAAPLAPEEASRIRFTLTAVEVEGVTVLSADDLRSFYSPLLNREISLLDLYQVAGKITAYYGNAGYILARAVVPPQTIADGAVRITVVEGYIDKVVFEGETPPRPELFQYFAEKIQTERPIRASTLERYLLLANDLPGIRAQSVLRPSAANIGAATLVLDLRRSGSDGLISVDNRGTESVGPLQTFIEANANSLFGRNERTTLRAATTPYDTQELNYLYLDHTQVLNGEGTLLGLSVTRSTSRPGTPLLRLLQVETEGGSGSLALSHPWVRSRSRNLTLSASLDYRTSTTRQLGRVTNRDRLYLLRFGAQHDNADAWGGTNLLSVNLTHGLNAFDAQAQSRVAAPADFALIELQASRHQPLSEQWSALLRLSGQYAASSLPSSELFGLGGESFGRAYDPSEWVGDQGAAVSLEVAYRPDLGSIATQFYLFYDDATVVRRRPVNEPEGQVAASAGYGVRLAMARGLAITLEAAQPLSDRASKATDTGWRYFGRVSARF